jgi:hypothetical protein
MKRELNRLAWIADVIEAASRCPSVTDSWYLRQASEIRIVIARLEAQTTEAERPPDVVVEN